jgi:hypothetical protein
MNATCILYAAKFINAIHVLVLSPAAVGAAIGTTAAATTWVLINQVGCSLGMGVCALTLTLHTVSCTSHTGGAGSSRPQHRLAPPLSPVWQANIKCNQVLISRGRLGQVLLPASCIH